MTDDQFEKHVERIPQMYQAATGPQIARHAVGPDRRPDSTKADATSEIAAEAVQKYRKTDPSINFKKAFDNVTKNNGVYIPETAAVK
jgi:hypothetical protein